VAFGRCFDFCRLIRSALINDAENQVMISLASVTKELIQHFGLAAALLVRRQKPRLCSKDQTDGLDIKGSFKVLSNF
jgi:hypothetical protein